MKRSLILASILVTGFCLPQEAHAWRFWGKEYTHIGLDENDKPVPCYKIYKGGIVTRRGCDTKSLNTNTNLDTSSAITNLSAKVGAVIVDNGNNSIIARRKYNLEQDDKTGWWRWSCKNSNESGLSATKRGARKEGRENCSEFNIEEVSLREAVLTFDRIDAKVEFFEP